MSENKPSLAQQSGADYLNHKERLLKAQSGHREVVHPKKYPAVTAILERPDLGHMEFTLDPNNPAQGYELDKRKRDLAKDTGNSLPESILESMATKDYGKDKIIEAGSYDPLCREKGIDLLTRGAGLERLKQVVAEIRRTRKGSVAIFFTDLDKFKHINDDFPEGHPGGDALIRCAAESLQQTGTRDTDFSVRYGGEELMKVLPGITRKAAKKLALTLQKRYSLNQKRALAEKGIFIDESDKELLGRDYGNFPSLDKLQTMSIGIAFVSGDDPRLDDPNFIDILLKEANEAEHAAKIERNRVAIMKNGKPVLVDPDLSEHPVTIEEISPEEKAKLTVVGEVARSMADKQRNDFTAAMNRLEIALNMTNSSELKFEIEEAIMALAQASSRTDELLQMPRYKTTRTPGGQIQLDWDASLSGNKASDLPE